MFFFRFFFKCIYYKIDCKIDKTFVFFNFKIQIKQFFFLFVFKLKFKIFNIHFSLNLNFFKLILIKKIKICLMFEF